MAATPSLADHLLVAASLALSVLHRGVYLRLKSRIKRREQNARVVLYRYILAVTWLSSAIVFWIWLAHSRPFSALGFGAPPWWRLLAVFAIAIAYVTFAIWQRQKILGRPDLLARISKSFGRFEPLIPTNIAERNYFRAVSITAGFCEELYFRGFLMWYLTSFAGPIIAILGSSAAFGLDHIYLGWRYAIRTGIVGLAFATIVVLAGSLLPAMLIHATADLVSGELGEKAFAAANGPATSI